MYTSLYQKICKFDEFPLYCKYIVSIQLRKVVYNMMRNYKKLLCVLGALFVFVTFSALTVHAEEETDDENKTGAPYFYVETEDPSLDCFPLK